MSGKFIDRTVFTAISATALYLFFLNAWGSIVLACLLSFVCCLILRIVILKRPVYFKCTRAQAEAEIMRIAQMSDDEAHVVLESIIGKRYPDDAFTLSPVVRHPSQSLSMADVFSQWKKHRHAGRLLIACTCAADPRAVMYAGELRDPRVAVIDKRHLMRMIRTGGITCEDSPRITLLQRIRTLPGRLALRHAGIKNALSGILLVGLYLFTGNGLYLFIGLASLFLFGCTLPGKRYKKRLFP